MKRTDPRTWWLWPLIVALAATGLLDLALQRVAYRVGLFMPRDGPLADAYGVVTWVGSLSFDLSSMLALLVLAGLAFGYWPRRPVQAVALGALLVLAATVPFARADAGDVARAAFAVAALAAALTVAAPALRSGSAPERLALFCVLNAVLAAQYRAAASAIAPIVAADPPFALESVRVAEVAAVAAAFPLALAALLARRPSRVGLLMSGGAAVAFAAAIVAQPYLSGIVLLWAAGVSLLLPLPAYAAAFAAYALSVLTESLHAERVHRAVGAILLLVAGVVPQSSAHAVVAIVAIALLAGPPLRSVATGPAQRSAAPVRGPAGA